MSYLITNKLSPITNIPNGTPSTLTITNASDLQKIKKIPAQLRLVNITLTADLVEILANKRIKEITFINCTMKEKYAEFLAVSTDKDNNKENVVFSFCILTHLLNRKSDEVAIIDRIQFMKKNGEMAFLDHTYSDDAYMPNELMAPEIDEPVLSPSLTHEQVLTDKQVLAPSKLSLTNKQKQQQLDKCVEFAKALIDHTELYIPLLVDLVPSRFSYGERVECNAFETLKLQIAFCRTELEKVVSRYTKCTDHSDLLLDTIKPAIQNLVNLLYAAHTPLFNNQYLLPQSDNDKIISSTSDIFILIYKYLCDDLSDIIFPTAPQH